MKPFFSILIPVFNQVGLMDRCIASITGQTFGEFEVILVDDGSTDASYDMCMEFCKKDDRFRILQHPKNASLLAARLTGMKDAKGGYILFVDSDDYLEKDSLELLHKSLTEKPVDILRFGYIKEFMDIVKKGFGLKPQDEEVLPLQTDDPLRAILTEQMVPNVWKNCYSAAVIKKAAERVEPFYCNMGEDVYWSTVLFTCAENDGTLDKCLYHYIIGAGMSTTSGNQTVEKLQTHANNIKFCIDHLREYVKKYAPEYLDLLEEKFIVMNCFILLMFCKDETDYRKIVNFIKVFDTEELAPVFDYGCNKVLSFKFREQYKITDEMLDKLGVEYPKFSMK